MSDPDFGSLHPDDVVVHFPNSEAKSTGYQAASGPSKEDTDAKAKPYWRPKDAILTEIGGLLGTSTADEAYKTLCDTKDPRTHRLDPDKVKEICAKSGFSAEERTKMLNDLAIIDYQAYKSTAAEIHTGTLAAREISSLRVGPFYKAEDVPADVRDFLTNLEWPLAACAVPGYTALNSWMDG